MPLNYEIQVNCSTRFDQSIHIFLLLFIGEYGFLLPENQIIPSGQETLAGEIALLKYIEKQVYS